MALLESRRIGSGETGKTTAHLTEVLDLRFRRLISKFGQSGAALAVRGHRAAILQIATFVRELGIDCDFEAQKGYLFRRGRREDLTPSMCDGVAQRRVERTFALSEQLFSAGIAAHEETRTAQRKEA